MPRTDTVLEQVGAPTVNDDINSDFLIGSEILDTATNKLYECLDNTAGAAVWVDRTNALSGEYVSISGPIEIGDNAVLTPAQITANQDDYSPNGWVVGGEVQVSFLILDASSNYNITGLEAPNPAKRMRVTIFNNSTTANITLVNNSGSSLAANRFISNGNITLNEKEALDAIYSTTESRWVVVTNT